MRAKRIQRQYQHVLVDEFQDVNDIQFFIAKALVHSGQTNSIFAVGDPNQSVYAFRGIFISQRLSCFVYEVLQKKRLTMYPNS
eukprot:UN02536